MVAVLVCVFYKYKQNDINILQLLILLPCINIFIILEFLFYFLYMYETYHTLDMNGTHLGSNFDFNSYINLRSDYDIIFKCQISSSIPDIIPTIKHVTTMNCISNHLMCSDSGIIHVYNDAYHTPLYCGYDCKADVTSYIQSNIIIYMTECQYILTYPFIRIVYNIVPSIIIVNVVIPTLYTLFYIMKTYNIIHLKYFDNLSFWK